MYTKKFKILYLINALSQVGPVNVLESIIRGLDRSLYEPHILVLRSEDDCGHDAVFAHLAVSIGYLRCSLWAMEITTGRVAERVAHYADALGANLLHLHGYHPDLLGACLSRRYRSVSTQHNVAIEDFRYAKGKFLGSYMAYRLWQALPRLTALVGISERVSSYCLGQCPELQVSTIYNGIDTERFRAVRAAERVELRKRLFPELPTDAELWLVCGALIPRKDPMCSLRAFVQLLSIGALSDKAHLLFLGDGPLLDTCRQSVGTLMLERVHFLGFRPNVQEYLAAGDYLISASHSEGFGLNVVEAILAGQSVVISDIGAHRELLQGLPKYLELMFAPGDAHALGQSMLRVRGMSLTEAERELVAERFSERLMAQRYMELYNSLLTDEHNGVLPSP